MVLEELDRLLIGAIEGGLPLVAQPYRVIADQLGVSESEVIERLQGLLEQGLIKRFGVVVRHHELGYRANAMVVWDIADERVATIGARLGQFDCVTLCYRRPRRLPLWPYNLFCMIHARNRALVLQWLDEIKREANLTGVRHAVLFSGRCFKQRGARYTGPDRAAVGSRVSYG